MTQFSAVAMKGAAGCCMTDLRQTNEGDSYLSALLADFWRFIGEYGVFRAAEIKKKRHFY